MEHISATATPPFSSPVQLATKAAAKALADAGVPHAACAIDTIAVVRLFSDSAGAWSSPFGGSSNLPESIARRIGARPQHRIYSYASGTQPLQLLREMFMAIAHGEKEMVLLAGAEAIGNQRFALRQGFSDDWQEELDVALDSREYSQRFASSQELNSGMSLPVHYYALIENYQSHQLGHTLEQHRQYMANLMAPFSAVAANNPYAQFKTSYSAEQLSHVDKANYPISLPYTKLLVAQDAVNQAAALLLTSVGNARQLGIDPGQWIFLDAYAEGSDQCLAQRSDPGRSLAMERTLTTALGMAELGSAEMDLVDLYSCFPCAVNAACGVLQLPTDGSGQLTVTGGLPFFGGPGSNYSMHALAEMASRLRHSSQRGLVTANGGIMSNHAAAVLSNQPVISQRADWCANDTLIIDAQAIPAQPFATNPNQGTVLSYTVIHQRDEADLGIILAETDAGERFLAHSSDPLDTGAIGNNCPIGRRISIQSEEQRHRFSFQT